MYNQMRMTCHKAIVMVTVRAHFFHDCLNTLILLLYVSWMSYENMKYLSNEKKFDRT